MLTALSHVPAYRLLPLVVGQPAVTDIFPVAEKPKSGELEPAKLETTGWSIGRMEAF